MFIYLKLFFAIVLQQLSAGIFFVYAVLVLLTANNFWLSLKLQEQFAFPISSDVRNALLWL